MKLDLAGTPYCRGADRPKQVVREGVGVQLSSRRAWPL